MLHAEADCLLAEGATSQVSQLLSLILARNHDQPGLSWCVGVGAPVDVQDSYAALGAVMASTLANRKVHPTVSRGGLKTLNPVP